MSDEHAPTPTRPTTIEWRCEKNHRVRMRIDSDTILVPSCKTCRMMGEHAKKRYAHSGILCYDDPGSAANLAPSASAATHLTTSELWTQFCTLLDAGRVRMGGGKFSERWCSQCEGQAHAGPRACTCQCHTAWTFRHVIEDAAKAA